MSARPNPLPAIIKAIRALRPEQLLGLLVVLDHEGLVEAGDYFLVSKEKLARELEYWRLLFRLKDEEVEALEARLVAHNPSPHNPERDEHFCELKDAGWSPAEIALRDPQARADSLTAEGVRSAIRRRCRNRKKN